MHEAMVSSDQSIRSSLGTLTTPTTIIIAAGSSVRTQSEHLGSCWDLSREDSLIGISGVKNAMSA